MKNVIFVISIIFYFLLSGCSNDGDNPLTPNIHYSVVSTDNAGSFAEEYFPIKTGNKWSYKVSINPIVTKIDDSNIIWDSDSIYSFEIGEYVNIKNINHDFENQVYGFNILHFKKHDSYYVKFKEGISLFNVTKDDMSAVVLLFDTISNNKYIDCEYRGEKEITIGLGTFITKTFVTENYDKTRRTIYYFAPKIGYVLYEYLDNKGNVLYRYTLIDYKIN